VHSLPGPAGRRSRSTRCRRESVRTAREIDPRTVANVDTRNAHLDVVQLAFGVARKTLRRLRRPDGLANLAQQARRIAQRAVEEQVGNPRLLFHALRERHERRRRRADIDDQVGLGTHDNFDVRRVAAPGEPSECRQQRHGIGQVRGLVGARRARPADELLRGNCEQQHCRGRPGHVHALHALRERDRASGRIGDRRLRDRHCRAAQRNGYGKGANHGESKPYAANTRRQTGPRR